jgi:hypothetical protein
MKYLQKTTLQGEEKAFHQLGVVEMEGSAPSSGVTQEVL